MDVQAPYSELLDEGIYIIVLPENVSMNGSKYRFVSWGDGYPQTMRTMSLVSDTCLSVLYLAEQVYGETPVLFHQWISMGKPAKKMVSPRNGSRHVKGEKPYRIDIASEDQARHVLLL